jgi:methionine salvage enolase-phosphatase E1
MVGRSVVRAVLFPYGNKLVTRFLDNQMNERFGNEFAKILDRTYHLIKENMIEAFPMSDSEEADLKASAVN